MNTSRPVKRSELLRQQRTQQYQQRPHHTATSPKHSHVATVVFPRRSTLPVTRDEQLGKPLLQKAQTAVRKKITIALMPNTELELPSIPTNLLSWRILSFLMTIVLSLGLWAFANTPELKVAQIELSGLERVPAADVEAVLQLYREPIYAIDPQVVRKRVENAFPEFKHAAIQIGLNNTVQVKVVERQPIIAWRDGDRITWIDAEGYTFPARGDRAGLILIKSDTPPPALRLISALPDPESFRNTPEPGHNRLVEILPSNRTDIALVKAAQILSGYVTAGIPIHYDQQQGFSWTDIAGWKVMVGTNLNEIDIKMVQYKFIVEEIKRQGIHPTLISMENLHAPFYRLNR